MIRKNLVILLLFVSASISAQRKKATLPFWDDFSISSNQVDSLQIWKKDTFLLWDYEKSKDVFVNASLAVRPPSYNVVSFDGLTAKGEFHSKSRGKVRGLADELTSTIISLKDKNTTDGIKLSFYWQAGGNVEMPNKGDSLRLQFALNDSTWVTVWKKEGSKDKDVKPFQQESISVAQAFLTEKFRFRFQSFGDLRGPFDVWHLDWIYLNEGRERDNLYYKDRSFTGVFTSPFFPFRSLPVSQLEANMAKLRSNPQILGANLDNQPQPIEVAVTYHYQEKKKKILIDSVLYGKSGVDTLQELRSNPNSSQFTVTRALDLVNLKFDKIPKKDSLVIESKVYIVRSADAQLDQSKVNLRVNDTIRSNFVLHNYLAFDDGTAEFAAGVNTKGGKIAVKYWLQKPDTLSEVAIYFPNIAPSSIGKRMTLEIHKRLRKNSRPLRSQEFTIKSGGEIDGFMKEKLINPVILSDTFYIVLKQYVNDYVGIGVDRNNSHASKYIYYNVLGEWQPNETVSGALMIRPVFGKSILLHTNKLEGNIDVYPNPVRDILRINGNYNRVEIVDMSGNVLVKQYKKEIYNLEKLKSGIYLLIIYSNNKAITKKIVKI